MIFAFEGNHPRVKKGILQKATLFGVRKCIINMYKRSVMNETLKDLKEIARAENVPYSGRNKAQLIECIQRYRDTVGTLYRENKFSLKKVAKTEGVRGVWNA